jgi:hypothetical protein
MSSLDRLENQSRVWIYGAERAMTEAETNQVRTELQGFVTNWVSHRKELKAGADVLHNRFIVVAVDETKSEASGCSIDGSVHFLQELGARVEVDFFNRMIFSYRDENNNVQTVSRDTFKELYRAGKLENDTIVFDPLVKELGELRQIFERPLEDSWHSRMV